MNRRLTVPAVIVGTAAIVSAVVSVPRLFVWNVTPSVPTGLYRIDEAANLRTGDRIVFDPPPRLARMLAERGYLPRGVPLLKEVAAVPGDRVCRRGPAISVNGTSVGTARDVDSLNRPMPDWQGCLVLPADRIFLMNLSVPDSFDGRYFGPVERGRIIGRAIPIWTQEPVKPGATPSERSDAQILPPT